MQRTVYDCDRCGAKEIPLESRLVVCTGMSPDPAGGPASNDYESVDLCQRCMAHLLMQLVRDKKVDGAFLLRKAMEKVKKKESS